MVIIALIFAFFKLVGEIFKFTTKHPILAILAVCAICTFVAIQMAQVGG